MTQLWRWLFGIPCRFCGERVRWPASEMQRFYGVCADCRRCTFEWLDEMGCFVTWPSEPKEQ